MKWSVVLCALWKAAFMEIGRVPIVHFFEVCGEFVPVGTEDIETSGRDYVVSIPERRTLPEARRGLTSGLGSNRSDEFHELVD